MKGHIQAYTDIREDEYQYRAYELGFPSFGGLSGAPVFFDDLYRPYQENYVIGMVTESVRPANEEGGVTDIRWTNAIDLAGVQKWLGEIDPCLGRGAVEPAR